MGRLRRHGSAPTFFAALLDVWTHWRDFFDPWMRIDIPDPWLADAARAGIVLTRCSYRGLEPSYQVGEGAYTKIPERSHALFPVAHYEFVWAQQLWNLTAEVEPYFQHDLYAYVLPDGNFTYNTQDQVEAPLNVGVCSGQLCAGLRLPRRPGRAPAPAAGAAPHAAIRARLRRLQSADAARVGPPPRADLGLTRSGPGRPEEGSARRASVLLPERGLGLARPVRASASARTRGRRCHGARPLRFADALWREGADVARTAIEMRANIERSLRTTLDVRNAAMKQAGITPFDPTDTTRDPKTLESYENHRFMMDWWTADWATRRSTRATSATVRSRASSSSA